MKKILTIALMALMVLPTWAGKATPKNWNFQLNDEGECVVENVYETSKDAAAALKAVKAAVNKQTFEERRIINQTNESLTYEIKKNTKSRYNPFAGNFNEAMIFHMFVVYADGKVTVKCDEFQLENRYEGYGRNVTNDTFSGKINEFEEAQEKAATSKGKVKKEAEEAIENINESLNMCQEELNNLFNAIRKGL
jgi:hypothetical protein